jgi:hypothetical protein
MGSLDIILFIISGCMLILFYFKCYFIPTEDNNYYINENYNGAQPIPQVIPELNIIQLEQQIENQHEGPPPEYINNDNDNENDNLPLTPPPNYPHTSYY